MPRRAGGAPRVRDGGAEGQRVTRAERERLVLEHDLDVALEHEADLALAGHACTARRRRSRRRVTTRLQHGHVALVLGGDQRVADGAGLRQAVERRPVGVPDERRARHREQVGHRQPDRVADRDEVRHRRARPRRARPWTGSPCDSPCAASTSASESRPASRAWRSRAPIWTVPLVTRVRAAQPPARPERADALQARSHDTATSSRRLAPRPLLALDVQRARAGPSRRRRRRSGRRSTRCRRRSSALAMGPV